MSSRWDDLHAWLDKVADVLATWEQTKTKIEETENAAHTA